MNVEGDLNKEKENEVGDEGDQHLQTENMMDELSFSDGLYLVDFRDCQFLQSSVCDSKLTKKYSVVAEKL